MAGRPKPETFVFFDLETTGLIPYDHPSHPHNGCAKPGQPERDLAKMFAGYTALDRTNNNDFPRIVELSMVAIPRSQLVDGVDCMQNLYYKDSKGDFRVHNFPCSSITYQMNPAIGQSAWEKYDQEVSKITHLYREQLICRPTLDKVWPAVEAFMNSLPSPIVLLAHNGLRFDYRILLQELKRFNLLNSNLFQNKVYFLDTLFAFMDIEKKDLDIVGTIVNNFDWSALSVCPQKRPRRLDLPDEADDTPSSSTNRVGSLSPTPEVAIVEPKDMGDCQADSLYLRRPQLMGNTTPSKQLPPPNEGVPRGVMVKCKVSHPLHYLGYAKWSPYKHQRLDKDQKLFIERDGTWEFRSVESNQYFSRGKFKLGKLYEDIFGCTFKQHRSQDDCFALLQVCMAYGHEFIAYTDRRCVQLQEYSQHPTSAP